MVYRKIGAAVSAAIVGLVVGGTANADGCSNRTVSGSYGAQLTGNAGAQLFAEVGIFNADGKGNVTGQDLINLGGTSYSRSLTGTYQVDPDCTATVELTLPDTTVAHFFGVVVLGGDAVLLNNTDQGNVVAGSIRKLNPGKSSDR
jgi:hypothetical protein